MSEKRAKQMRRMHNAPKACIMCNTVGKRTSEHVIPSWLVRSLDPGLFQGHGAHVFLRSRGIDRTTRYTTYFEPKDSDKKRSVKRMTVHGVCKTCNEGWMGTLEKRLHWMKDFFLACRGQKPHSADTLQNDRFAALMLSRERQVDLMKWALLKAITVSLGSHDSGELALTPTQVTMWREMVNTLRTDDLPVGLEAELATSFTPGVPFGCGAVLFARNFVFATKMGGSWIRLLWRDPREPTGLLRAAFVGDLMNTHVSRIPTIGKVKAFGAARAHDELRLLLHGILPTPEGFAWEHYYVEPWSMEEYTHNVEEGARMVEMLLERHGANSPGAPLKCAQEAGRDTDPPTTLRPLSPPS